MKNDWQWLALALVLLAVLIALVWAGLFYMVPYVAPDWLTE